MRARRPDPRPCAALYCAARSLHLALACPPARAQPALELARAADAARSHLYLGEYGAALVGRGRRTACWKQQPDAKDTAAALVVLSLRGTIHIYLGQPREAKKVFEEGKALVPAILAGAKGDRSDFASASFQAAQFFKGMAIAELLTGNAAGAQEAVANAWSAARDSGLNGVGEYLGLPRLQAQAAITTAPQGAEAMRRAREIVSQSGDSVGSTIQDLFEKLTATLSLAQAEEFLKSATALLAAVPREDRIEIHARLARASRAPATTPERFGSTRRRSH